MKLLRKVGVKEKEIKLSGIKKKKKRLCVTTVTIQERSILACITGFSYMTRSLADGGARRFPHRI